MNGIKIVKEINSILRNILIFFLKIDFLPPPKQKVLIFDKNSEIVTKLLKLKNYSILHVRFEQINLSVLILVILSFKFSLAEYCKKYIDYVKPQIIITTIDNNLIFYKLKKQFNNILFISIQNGTRTIIQTNLSSSESPNFLSKFFPLFVSSSLKVRAGLYLSM